MCCFFTGYSKSTALTSDMETSKNKEIGHAIISSDKRVINALCSREAEYNRTGNERKSKVFHFRAIGQLSKDSIKVLRRTHASL